MERKEKLRVRVKLNSIVLRLNNDGSLLATLTLSTADVAVMLRGNTIRVAARLGSLLLYDNAKRSVADPHFKKLLSIQGDELADFTYETFDQADAASYLAMTLRSGCAPDRSSSRLSKSRFATSCSSSASLHK